MVSKWIEPVIGGKNNPVIDGHISQIMVKTIIYQAIGYDTCSE